MTVLRAFLLPVTLFAAAYSGIGHAQVVERNLPPAPEAEARPIAGPNAVPENEDETPIGPALSAIVLLGPQDEVVGTAQIGIDASRIARLETASARERLAPYLGRPLSRKLIAEIQAEIALHYRGEGFPFVSLSTPEQEITEGVLQIRVVEFTAGEIQAVGGSGTTRALVTGGVRLEQGGAIDSRTITEDLAWLNRNPFRDVEAVFSPGDRMGRSNLTLAVKELRPWSVYAGVANSGSELTGFERFYAGFQAAPLRAAPDFLVSYQATASRDLFEGGPVSYLSHAGIFDIGLGPRAALELTLNHVRTRQDSWPFFVDLTVSEGTMGVRQASGALGDLRVGIEARRSRRDLSFGPYLLFQAKADILQIYAGFEKNMTDALGRSSIGVSVHLNPGPLGNRNDRNDLAFYTAGRVTSSRYAYVEARYERSTRLAEGLALGTEIIARAASAPLPDTDQAGLGGAGLVRGYTTDDGGFDSAILMRNTLYLPAVRVGPRDNPVSGALRPYLFADGGRGRNRASAGGGPVDRLTAFSFGSGMNYRVRSNLSGTLEAARALKDGPFTKAGNWRVHASLTLSY